MSPKWANEATIVVDNNANRERLGTEGLIQRNDHTDAHTKEEHGDGKERIPVVNDHEALRISGYEIGVDTRRGARRASRQWVKMTGIGLGLFLLLRPMGGPVAMLGRSHVPFDRLALVFNNASADREAAAEIIHCKRMPSLGRSHVPFDRLALVFSDASAIRVA